MKTTPLGSHLAGRRFHAAPLIDLRGLRLPKGSSALAGKLQSVRIGRDGALSVKLGRLPPQGDHLGKAASNADLCTLALLLVEKRFHLLLANGDALFARQAPGLESMASLELRGTAISDAGMPHLLEFNNLRELGLAGTDIGYNGLQSLSLLRNIESLNLGDTGTDDNALGLSANWADLRHLNLFGCRGVTDQGIEIMSISNLVQMRSLNLIGTRVTGEGLPGLRTMVFLEQLLVDNNISDHPNARMLREKNPKLQIISL